ncbi:Uma2 family endonuclease [Spirulina major CS-329]|uniref:Uma2 family endonuclease n=1 Tax=Spirulina TaxID=1154 RepID=UPI00232AC5B0|nr:MULTISPECIES: Uma2 family endonuclease [Spirulina]MDB9493983.1 Uma2 family endonuclease [Spirulina subsalsa CS-330]MDB9502664.1 Uma2 family endonuclease [Spirulina major CS-329]
MVQTPVSPQSLFLALPPDLTLKVTPEQFAALAVANRELRLERTATGELIVNPPTGGQSGKRNCHITGQLSAWSIANEQLGEAFDSSTGFILPNGANRSPDASWVRRDRWDALTPAQQEGFIPLCPDFVVELRSHSDSLNTTRAKLQEYLNNGAQLGWLIDPQNQRIEIYRPGQTIETLDHPDTISGEPTLPGFSLNLQRIWA